MLHQVRKWYMGGSGDSHAAVTTLSHAVEFVLRKNVDVCRPTVGKRKRVTYY
jgi:hypothetical protein